jgi:ABC-type nitrate/sulfonate/bicarbonate transport system substrate-binding protein
MKLHEGRHHTCVRLTAILLATLVLAGCGATGTTGEFGDVTLLLPAKPSADDVGVYFAVSRGFDEAEGVSLQPARRGTADFRITTDPPADCVAVLAIVQPDKRVLCVDKFILGDDRDKVKAVAAALARGYTQAQLEPDEAAQAMEHMDATRVEDAAPTWTAGAKRFGQLRPGPGRDPLY